METQDAPGAENPEGGKPSRALQAVLVVGFGVAFVGNLLRGRWVTAAFFLAVGLLFLKGKEVDRWPKAARYLFMLVYAALAAGMLVQLVWDVKARW